jgi:hypothetical protein
MPVRSSQSSRTFPRGTITEDLGAPFEVEALPVRHPSEASETEEAAAAFAVRVWPTAGDAPVEIIVGMPEQIAPATHLAPLPIVPQDVGAPELAQRCGQLPATNVPARPTPAVPSCVSAVVVVES